MRAGGRRRGHRVRFYAVGLAAVRETGLSWQAILAAASGTVYERQVSQTADAPDVDPRRILSVVLVPLFMSLLSVSIVNVVLPSISDSIGASTSALQWVLSGYTLAFGVLLVPGGRAGDVFGRGRLFVIGVIVFGVGALAAGLSPDPVTLNIARVLMGFGSGLLNPQTVGLIQQYFQGAARGRAFGMFGSVVGVSVAVGPVLGGALIALAGREWGWRLAFLVNVPIAAAAVLLAFLRFPASAWHGTAESSSASSPQPDSADSEPEGQAAKRRVDLDPVGNILLALSILAIMLPFLERAAGPWLFLLIPVGIVLVWIWVRWERRYARRGGTPMVELGLFRTRSFGAGTLLVTLYFLGVTSVWVVVAIFTQNGHGFTAIAAGMIGLPAAICSAISANLSGRFVTRVGRPLVVAGTAVCIVGLASSIVIVWLNSAIGLNLWWLLLTLSFVGIAQGMVISPNQTLTLAEVPIAYAGSAGGVLQTGQRIGTAIGIALLTALFFSFMERGGWNGAFMVCFAAIAVVVALAGVVGLYDWGKGRREARGRGSRSSS